VTRFLYTSYVSDDVAAATAVLGDVGFVPVWRGEHPALGVDAVLCAARRGGVLVLAAGGDHELLASLNGARERMSHFALAVPGDEERERFLASDAVDSVSEPYAGPAGETRLVALSMASGGRLWVEIAGDVAAGDEAAQIARIESTPMVAAALTDFRTAFAGLTEDIRDHIGETIFPTLGARSEVIILEDWHFLEFNEPVGDGVIGKFLETMQRPGPFGMSVEPVDMDAFIQRMEDKGIKTNTREPIVLPVIVEGRELESDAIVTLSPNATRGARIFVLNPLDYPWSLV
jgi:hypothetical protein